MHIAVYSGSFNPLHLGHYAIMRYLTSDRDFDKVYLIVSPKNPLKDGIGVDSAQQRYEAACRAIARHSELKVQVDDIEMLMPPPQYTIRTLDALAEREPGYDFTLIIGADNLNDLRRWRDYGRILTDYGVAVYPRSGFDMEADKAIFLAENPSYRITLLSDAPQVDLSSTQLRHALAQGQDISHWLM